MTHYGLDGPGIAPVQTGPGAHPASCRMGNGSFPGVKRPGRVADHPPPSKCRGQERVELYLYSLFGPSWPVMEAPFPFTADLMKSHAFMKCLYGVHNFATVNHNCGSLNRTKKFFSESGFNITVKCMPYCQDIATTILQHTSEHGRRESPLLLRHRLKLSMDTLRLRSHVYQFDYR